MPDSLADDFIPASFDVLRPCGRFLEIGKRGIWTYAQVAALGKNIAYHIIYLGEVTEQDLQLIGGLFGGFIAQFKNAALHPLPIAFFHSTQAADAFRYMAQARHVGKLVLTQPPSPPRLPRRSYLMPSDLWWPWWHWPDCRRAVG